MGKAAEADALTATRRHVLVVDDELGVRESLRMALRERFQLSFATNGEEALALSRREHPDAVLLDILMPGLDGIATLRNLLQQTPTLPVIMLTATRTVKTAVEAIKLGAFDYVQKPFDTTELLNLLRNATRTGALQKEVEELRAEVGRRYQLGNLVGRSRAIQDVLKTVAMVAPLPTTVLITGESGTGKDLVARAIHHQSPRGHRRMSTINCAAIPESLIETELFGHERGAFTGAESRKLGQFEYANGSTVFLDEIGELPPPMQAKLLRVLQTGEFMRVGGTKPVSVDVRFLAASNRNLEEAIVTGEFRSDLFYRLNVVSVHLLPLRDRREDLPLLIRHFTTTKAAELGVEERSFTPEAIDAILCYHWPGNVRELENLIERVLVLSSSGPIRLDELPDALRREGNRAAEAMRDDVRAGKRSLPDAVSQFEREMIREALEESQYNQTRAARRLGTTRRILKYRMDKLGISER